MTGSARPRLKVAKVLSEDESTAIPCTAFSWAGADMGGDDVPVMMWMMYVSIGIRGLFCAGFDRELLTLNAKVINLDISLGAAYSKQLPIGHPSQRCHTRIMSQFVDGYCKDRRRDQKYANLNCTESIQSFV